MHDGVGLRDLRLGLSLCSIRVRVSRSCPRYVQKCLYTGLALRMVYTGHLWTGLENQHSFSINVIFGRPFIKRFALFYQTIVCPVLSCLSVSHVGALWPKGWMDQDETWHAGPGHIVLDSDPTPPPPKGHSPQIFGPYLLWTSGWMDQDATW